jgi:large subunit ribosomal protein L10
MLNKIQKKDIIEKTKTLISNNNHIIFVTFSGVPTSNIETLRRDLKALNCNLKMIKKTLGDIAIKEVGIDGINIKKNYKGSIGFVFITGDLFSVINTLFSFKKKNKDKFQILGAILEKQPSTVETINKLSSFSSLKSLYTSLVFVLNSNIQQLVFALDQIKTKKSN